MLNRAHGGIERLYANHEPLWVPGRTLLEAAETPCPHAHNGHLCFFTHRAVPCPGSRHTSLPHSGTCEMEAGFRQPSMPSTLRLPSAVTSSSQSPGVTGPSSAPGRTSLQQQQSRTTAGPAKDRDGQTGERKRREEKKGRNIRENKDVRRTEGK